MNIKISSIRIRCKKENVFVQLSNRISFIYGNAGVGKTTLLNLISYGLGNNLVKTLAVEQEVLGVCLNVLINGELISLERKINSNSIILSRNNEKVNLVAKRGKNPSQQTFSDFLYSFGNLKPIVMLRRNSSKESKVTFANFMWFSYLRQEELDNTLFYLGEEKSNYKELASTYVMKILLGEKEVSDKEVNKEINKLRERQESIKVRVSVAREIYSHTKLLDVNLSQEIAKKQKEVIRLKEEVEILKSNLLQKDSSKIEVECINELLEKQRRIGIYEAETRYLGEFAKINEVKNRYLFEWQQCEDRIAYYEKIKESTDNQFFDMNIEKLERIFFMCLLDVGFSYIESSDMVKIDKKNFVPSVYSKYGDFKFDYSNLSSGGKKTIFKICYAIAIYIYAIENDIHSILPQFIIIDTPMKNISEREDKELYENLYLFFDELFSDNGKLHEVQLILVDKELPQVFKSKDVMCKHMTNEEPLIPI